jgi:hypothetical protein
MLLALTAPHVAGSNSSQKLFSRPFPPISKAQHYLNYTAALDLGQTS